MIGSLAPKFPDLDFIKGGKVYGFETGRIYVIEFWATWCDPCLKAVPHLSKLQSKFPTACIIGIAIKELDKNKVVNFVKENENIINYAIAINPNLEGSSQERGMIRGWLKSAYKNTIPIAFIVDATSRIAWIGHPMELEGPLSSIINGSWDIESVARSYNDSLILNKIEKVSKLEILVAKYTKANDLKSAIATYSDFFETHPELEGKYGKSKLALLILDNCKSIEEYANHLVNNHYRKSRKNRIAVGGMIANDVINLSKIDDRTLDVDLVWLAHDILIRKNIDDLDDVSSSSLMLLEGSLALIFLALKRPDDAITHAKIAQERAIESNANHMLDVIDEIIHECGGDKNKN